MFYDHEDHHTPVATMADACREYVSNIGEMDPDRAWIVSQYDTLEANPHYAGPIVPHPYDEEAEWLAKEALAEAGDPPAPHFGHDTAIPF